MLIALWHLSATIRGYLRFYMPTNRAVDWLRSPRGLKWAIPVALVATPTYLGLTALAIQLAARPGLGFVNVLVFLFFWDAAKFSWMAVLSFPMMAIRGLRFARLVPNGPNIAERHPEEAGPTVPHQSVEPSD